MPKTNKATPSRLYKKVNERVPVPKNIYLELYKRFAHQVKKETLNGNDWVTRKFGMLGIRAVAVDPFNRPIDWNTTKKLWEDCPECAEARQLVHYLNKYSYRMQWLKQKGAKTPAVNYYWFKMAETYSDDLTIQLRNGKEYDECKKSKYKKRTKQAPKGHSSGV